MPGGRLRSTPGPESDREPTEFEREQTELAAAEAGAIGGRTTSEPPSVDGTRPTRRTGRWSRRARARPRDFEEAERELAEHAGHGDQHAAGRILQDASPEQDDDRAEDAGEANFERSSERDGQD